LSVELGQKPDHVLSLLQKGEVYKEKKQILAQAFEHLEDYNCTFKPEIKTTYHHENRFRDGSPDLITHLYRHPNYKSKRDKSRDDFEYEDGKQDCVFQPNSHKFV